MNDLITQIHWTEKTSVIDDLLHRTQEVDTNRLPAGLEAVVWEMRLGDSRFVLKNWNKESNPDVGFQYALLHALHEQGIAASVPFGWGYDAANHKVLVTSFDGSPVQPGKIRAFIDLAGLLLDLHKLSLDDFDPALHRKFDFIAYYYPRLHEHPDIQSVLSKLVANSGMQQNKMIHGDVYLGNLVEHQGRYTLIDWTNAQLGDPRYDAAWAAFLIRIYSGEEGYDVFLDAYLAGSGYSRAEMETFEAIACLRWVLLNRIADVPKPERTIDRVNHAIDANVHLNRELMVV
ncbi:phosphotransferase [Paenibacillus allorhizosphaerae]|uniref:Aminoglycoside phosphotransferase domain-containing protein n=1 Tax=Paenibacillus allorhizosphaerae TaxID=2849866 RepID=A0ABN7THT2_9BACL|nr:phosphotransferase [Paenibacillus allorhizosphaerae]CAG7630445.1 hypothetical protein PAECIP111802_01637 [Paenibacillus allorhizosphaerae]